MKERKHGGNGCKIYALLGIWTLLLTFVVSGYVQAAEEPEGTVAPGEELTELSLDGVFSAGGLDYTASAEDFEEAAICLNHWEADGTAAYAETGEEYTSAEEALAAAFDRYENVVKFPTDPDTAAYTVKKSEAEDLVNRFLNSHPEYFYIDKMSMVSLSNGLVKNLNITYRASADAIDEMRAAYQKEIEEAVSQINENKLDDSRICMLVHDYLVNHITYENDKTNEWRYTAYSALVNGRAVCQGYALAYQAILNQLGIPCIMVASSAIDHAWNLVEVDGHYYHVDVTWDDSNTLPGQVFHSNLLLSREDIESTGHTGYTLDASVKDKLAPNSIHDFWQNVYSRIYYYEDALYYIYPGDVSDTSAEASSKAQFLFVKKPVAGNSTENVTLAGYTFADIEVSGGNEAAVKERQAQLRKQLRSYGRLERDGSRWYFTTAYGIYSVDLETAKKAAAAVSVDKVYRIGEENEKEPEITEGTEITEEPGTTEDTETSEEPETTEGTETAEEPETTEGTETTEETEATEEPGTTEGTETTEESGTTEGTETSEEPGTTEAGVVKEETVVFGISSGAAFPIINGLQCEDSKLYYQVENGSLTAVPKYETAPWQAQRLYLYEAGRPLVLSVDKKYQLHPYLLPDSVNQQFSYQSSAENLVSVSPNGVVEAKAYTRGTPVTITVSGGGFVASVQVEVSHVKVQELLLSNGSISLQQGQTKRLTASISPGNATCQEVEFSALDETGMNYSSEVVTVDESGLVTAVAPGTAYVNARVVDFELNKDGSRTVHGIYEQTCRVTVTVKPVSIALSAHTLNLAPGEQGALGYTLSPENVTNQKAAYHSSDTSVASVSAEGVVTAKAEGTAVITVTASEKDNNGNTLTDTCVVTVAKKTETGTGTEAPQEVPTKVSGVKLNKKTLTIAPDGEAVLTATVLPETAINQNIIWTSSDKTVAKVKAVKGTKKATVSAVNLGEAVIRVTTAEGAYVASCKVTVSKPSVKNAVVTNIGKKTYTGKAIKPSVTVKLDGKKLKKDRDYTVSYKNNKKIGTATITIKGKGDYAGTKKITFSIVPGMPEAKAAAAKKAVWISYKKVTGADGYQLVYAADKSYTKDRHSVWIKQNKIFGTKVDKLKSKKTYYFKIRSYKTVSGKKVYSAYCNIGKVKTK